MPEQHTKIDNIYVNGTPHAWEEKEISYAQVVLFAFPDGDQTLIYSITYKNGHGDKPEGTLSPGGSVKVKDEMSFRVSPTGQS